MNPAAKHFDPVVGVDVHIIQPPGPVPPVPVPHPFVGMIIDPFDYAPILGATVKVNGLYRAIAGTQGKCIPSHIPIGGVFVKPPANECEMFMGSKTVLMDGDVASYMALPALSCQDIGAPPIPRLWKRGEVKSLVLPTSTVLPIPAGPPVLIGGPPVISLFQMLMKVALWGLGKALKKFFSTKLGKRIAGFFGKAKKKLFGWMKPGFIKCKILKAEPVNLITGEVVYAAEDFRLPGRIPLRWVRRYGSHQRRPGLCGVGWETPADMRLQFEADGRVVLVGDDPGGTVFERLPERDGSVREMVGGAELHHGFAEILVVTPGGLRYHFPRPQGAERELLVQAISDLYTNRLRFVRDEHGLRCVVFDDGRRVMAECRNGRIVALMLHHPAESKPRVLVRYDYSRHGELTAVYDALGAPHRFAYEQQRLIKHTDRGGLSFYYAYDEVGRCTNTHGDGGLYRYHFEYLDAAGETWVTDSLGAITVTQYTPDYFPVAQIDPLGQLTLFEYDAVGRTTAVIDPAGRRTAYEYDERGNLIKQTAPDGTSTTLLRDASGAPAGLVSPTGRTWRWQRDQRGLVVKRVLPSGAAWEFLYNERGDLFQIIDPLGGRSEITCDRFGSVVAFTDAAGRQGRVERDALGHVTLQIGADDERSACAYDVKGRLRLVVYPDGSQRRFAYNATDNLVSRWDENGGQTQWRYEGLGRVAEKISADGTRIRFVYDTEDRAVAVVNELGQTYRLEYDPLGRVVRKTDYWGKTWRYEYDRSGDVCRRVDPLGRAIEYGHDVCGRLTLRKPADAPAERFVYDPDGRLLVATSAVSTVKFTYHPDGPVTEEVQDGFRVAVERDGAGRVIGRESGYGRVVRLARDLTGSVTRVTLGEENLLEVEYDKAGVPVRERLLGGFERNATYGRRGELLTQGVRRNGRVVHERTYRHDAAGHLLGLKDSLTGQFDLENDGAGQVRGITGPDGQARALARSAIGAVLHEVPGAVRTAHGLGLVCEYDDAGQLVRRRGPDGESQLHWDALGRLVEVVNAQGQRVRFGYDPLGRRVFKESGDRRVVFRWHGDCLLGDEAPDTGPREFVYRPGSLAPLAAVGEQTLLYDTGLAGIPHALLSPEGSVVWAAEPDVFAGVGRARVVTADQPLRLQGQYFDAETGLCYNRFRYYDPYTGRFLSQDPLGLVTGTDPYAYAPNVWSWIDPLGLSGECWSFEKAIAFARKVFQPGSLMHELKELHVKAKAGQDVGRELEAFAQRLSDETGIGIYSLSREAYEDELKRFGTSFEKSGPATLQNGNIYILEDAFSGPKGPKEVAHEVGAAEIMDRLGVSKDNIPEAPSAAGSYLTQFLDMCGGFAQME